MKLSVKKWLRYSIGTLIFLPFSPLWMMIDWMLEDKATLRSSFKAAEDNWKSMVTPPQLEE